ncbi:MAG TPA: cupin domain-containing protein [Gemmatimonadaceae bacterium]|nr:cupin domain-containing protein [Gemmatimonadaceae bacterium]
MTSIAADTGTTRSIRFLGNNEITVLVSGEESGGAFSVMELVIQPRGGATALHTDQWIEVFHVIEGEVEWTLERDGQLETWTAHAGDTVTVPRGAKHKFAGAGNTPSRLLTIGGPEYEQFFRALASAWAGPYDREKTPQAVGPVFARFGMELCAN